MPFKIQICNVFIGKMNIWCAANNEHGVALHFRWTQSSCATRGMPGSTTRSLELLKSRSRHPPFLVLFQTLSLFNFDLKSLGYRFEVDLATYIFKPECQNSVCFDRLNMRVSFFSVK